jgi:hypothetical protein
MITGATLQDAREQTLRTVVDHLLRKNADYRDLFTTRSTFISRALGPVYHVGAAPGWAPYELPADSGRAGILTHVSFLALHAHPARSSATLRGKALREVFLCQKVPPPPPNVDFSAVEDPDSSLKTAREKLEVHRSNASCAGCHKIMDPIGLTLENFDGAGQFRASENGAQIDASGDLDGKPFKDAVGLGEAIRNSPALRAGLRRLRLPRRRPAARPCDERSVLEDHPRAGARREGSRGADRGNPHFGNPHFVELTDLGLLLGLLRIDLGGMIYETADHSTSCLARHVGRRRRERGAAAARLLPQRQWHRSRRWSAAAGAVRHVVVGLRHEQEHFRAEEDRPGL